MHTIPKLIESYRAFRDSDYPEHARLYKDLGQGQHPEVMMISCADSRVEPAEIFHANPGDLFVVRNVANIVPAFEDDGLAHSVSAALEYAVTALKIPHIVVMGHGGCGGVNACLSAVESGPVGTCIAPWVSMLDETRDKVLATNPSDPQKALELAGIIMSMENLMTFPFIREAVEAGNLILHGAWFEIESGELHWRDKKTGAFGRI
ncbi:MAG: carbonic anhydrase [Henriciella sp.]|nr:carbonic anhydrase [Hyphomonadaceae bacterium]